MDLLAVTPATRSTARSSLRRQGSVLLVTLRRAVPIPGHHGPTGYRPTALTVREQVAREREVLTVG